MRHHSLRAIAHVEAHENDADVALDGGLGDAQFGGDLLVALAVEDEIEDFALAGTEIGVGDARVECAR
jgi:hypothetical protein